jgi:hypothetical protein
MTALGSCSRRLPPFNGRSLSPRYHDPSRDVFSRGISKDSLSFAPPGHSPRL